MKTSVKGVVPPMVTPLVNGRVPVLVGITDTVFAESLKMADFAKACGATALVAAPREPFNAADRETIRRRLVELEVL